MSLTLAPEVIIALSKKLKTLSTKYRKDLPPGTYTIEGMKLLLELDATVRVGEPYTQRFPQLAKPWELVAILLEELNKERLAANKIGLDLSTIVKMAAEVSPDIAAEAKSRANEATRELKQPTLKSANGKIISTAELTLQEV